MFSYFADFNFNLIYPAVLFYEWHVLVLYYRKNFLIRLVFYELAATS